MKDLLFPIIVFVVAVVVAVTLIFSLFNRPTTIVCPDGTEHTIYGDGVVYC